MHRADEVPDQPPKAFAYDGGQATVYQAFNDLIVEDLGTGAMVADFKQAGLTDWEWERLKMFMNTPVR